MTIGRRLLLSLPLVLLALFLARPARAQGPDDLAGWQVLAEGVRVTFYGPRYIGDHRLSELMASGVPYTRDGDTVALGPALLTAICEHYYRQAQLLGHPLAWGWEPGLKLWQSGNIAGCYFVPVSLREARLWGCGVRVCAENAAGAWYCQEFRVMDTGGHDPDNGIELGVDLPDERWADWEYPASRGVFTGTVEVLGWWLDEKH